MARVTIRKDLDARIAKMIRPHVDAVAKDVEREARRTAPAIKEWTTQRDAKVRHTHVRADRQQRPANLRFELQAAPWDQGIGREPDSEGKPRSGPFVYFDHPGERIENARGNWINCRCYLVHDAKGLARRVEREEATVVGNVARARVYVTAPFAVEAEIGDAYPGGYVAEGTYFMARAARSGAARSRARR